MDAKKTHFTRNEIGCETCSLNQICLPKGLSQDELEKLDSTIEKTIKVKKKQALFSIGDSLDGVFAVKAGAVKTTSSNRDGVEQVLGFHLPGDMLGFDAFDTNRHKCNAITLEDTLLCKVSMQLFDDLCIRVPGIRNVMRHQIGKEITHNQNMLLSLGQQQADERLAVFLIQLATYYQSRGFSGKEFTLPMTKQDLANYLGMAVETLSRLFSRFNDEKIIKTHRRIISIRNRNALEVLAHAAC